MGWDGDGGTLDRTGGEGGVGELVILVNYVQGICVWKGL